MPFTFSHPAAILPFSKSSRLSQTGLIIGSIVPDLEFYFKLRLSENIGHTLTGIFLFDLPIAVLVAFIFHAIIKAPLYEASPMWIKSRMTAYLNFDWIKSTRKNMVALLLSVCIGIVTHLLLDGITHHDGWAITLFPLLENTLKIGSAVTPFYDILQYGLSVLGLYWMSVFFINLKPEKDTAILKMVNIRFWVWVLIVGIAAIEIRMFFFPLFISFWDGFMMVVGALFYGILLASTIEVLISRILNGNSQRNKFINSRSTYPRFKSRSLFIKQDEFFGLFGKGIVHVNNFIDETQVIVRNPSDIQINQIDLSCGDIIQSVSQKFCIASFGLTCHFNFQGRFIFSGYRKIADLYFHNLKCLKKYINTTFKLIGFCGLIFLPILSDAQEVEIDPVQREQYIQQAIQMRADENYAGAIAQLDSILAYNETDAQILLFKGDLCLQNQDYDQAVEVYAKLVPLEYERTVVQVNLSYALFMSKKPSKALEAAYSAWNQDRTSKSAVVNYFNAMLWNVKTKDAEKYLEENLSVVDTDQALVMKARLLTTAGNYSQGLAYYDTLVQQFPNAPYIQEYAEVLIGKKQWKKSQKVLSEYDSILSDSQKQRLNGLLNQGNNQSAGLVVGYFADIAKNTRTEQSVFWQNQFSAPIQVGVRVGANQVRDAESQVTKSTFVSASISRVWSQAWQSSAVIMLQKISPSSADSFTGATGNFETKFQPNDRRMFGISYSSDILNFTADLLGKDIRSHNLGYMTHLMFDGKTGFYSQGSYGRLNDNNTRLQFFGSVYRLLRTEPTLKTGLNFSALSFSDTETTLYFAPDQFMSTEVFVDYSTPMPLISKLALKMQAAAGFQQIEKQGWDPSFRAEAEFNYRYQGFDLGIKGQFSNVAAASGTGYKFQYFTFKVIKSF